MSQEPMGTAEEILSTPATPGAQALPTDTEGGTGGDQPVEAQDALELPDEQVESPSTPSDQPPLPDFNS